MGLAAIHNSLTADTVLACLALTRLLGGEQWARLRLVAAVNGQHMLPVYKLTRQFRVEINPTSVS